MKLETSKLFKTKFSQSKNVRQLTQNEREKVHEILFEMLCDIDTMCKKNNIPFCLCGGSALGAVRHHDFIPWDDDLDIYILRNDIKKFLGKFEKEYGEKYIVVSPGYRNFYDSPTSHICKRGTVFRSYANLGEKNPGIGCDICILENTYDFAFMRLIHGCGSLLFGLLVSCRRFYRDKKILLKYAEGDKELRKAIMVKAYIGKIVSIWTYEQIVKFQYIWNSQCSKKNSKYVVCINGRKHFFGEIYVRKDMIMPEQYEFHGKQVAVMGQTNRYLHHLYGDYMTIPKDEDKESMAVLEFKLS